MSSLLFILALLEDCMSLSDLLLEVIGVSEQFLVVDGRFIQNHTSDGRSLLFTICLEDGWINVVTNEVITLLTL